MKDRLNNGELVSNESTMIFENSAIMIGNGQIHVPPGHEIVLGKRDSVTTVGGSQQGDKPVLVRVTDVNGKVVPQSTAAVGDDIFGTNGDPVNMKSQFFACSWGKLNIIPGDNKGKSTIPGVIDVTIPIALDGGYNIHTIHNAVTIAAQTKLGFDLPGSYQQVMYVLEQCYTDCGWAAYAFINSWMSVYQGNYYSHSAVQMHELGHNFGFAHSGGLNGAAYTDHTCLMGNPLYSDDVGKMCFNSAKNWQIGWYDDKREVFVPSNKNYIWHKRMVGIANYGNDNSNHPVILKIETGTPNDYFVAFNRATGINQQNDEADNEVTVVLTGNNGESFSQSQLKATLRQGETHKVENWNGSNKDLTIAAEVINIRATVGYADIKICYGSCQAPPSTSPSTGPPTKYPTKYPTILPTKTPTKSPTKHPTTLPTKTPVKSPSVSPTTFPTSPPTKLRTKSPKSPPTMSPFPTATRPPECEDASAVFLFDKIRRDCKWVRDSNPSLCSNYKIKITCPSTCKTCQYQNSDANLPFLPFYPEKTSKWTCSKLAGIKKGYKKKHCALPNFYQTCRATCDEPFPPPSTALPTMSPTSWPTSSPSPTSWPTSSPSPTFWPTSSPPLASIGWRLWSSTEHTFGLPWDVVEIEFFESKDCTGDKIPNTGTAFDSSHFISTPPTRFAPKQAFGGSGRWGGRPDSDSNYYIGMMYPTDVAVCCAKVFNYKIWPTRELVVQVYNENNETANWEDIVVAKDLDISSDAVNIIDICSPKGENRVIL